MSQSRTSNSALAERMSAVESSIGSIQRDVHAITASLDALRTAVHASTRTHWGPIIGAGSFVVALVTAIVSLGARGPLDNLQRLDVAVEGMRKTRFTDAQGESLEDRFEQRLLRLEERMRREIELTERPIKERLARVKAEALELRTRFIEHVKDGHPNRIEQRLEMVEAEQRRRSARVYRHPATATKE